MARAATEVVERARARVNLAAIERNCARLRGELSGETRLCAVVKADAYGHGAVQSARAALAGGASWLAVVEAAELGELRAAGLGEVPVLVMGALTEDELRLALADGGEVVVWSEEAVEAVAAAGGGRRPRQARLGHGPARNARPRACERGGGGRRARARRAARRADDPLRHRRRTG